MASSPQKLQSTEAIFERLQARFPQKTNQDPSSPISSGMAALERRASNRSNRSNKSLPAPPPEYLAQGSRTVSPSGSRLKLSLETDTGIRSTASSPGPPRRAAPPPIRTKTRPTSELFLPTPTTGKGFCFSKLIREEGEWLKEDKDEENALPVVVSPPLPMSPISASIAAAIARLDVHASVQSAISNLSVPDHLRFRFDLPARSSTAPPSILRRQTSFLSIKSSRSLPLRSFSTRSNRPGGSSSRGAGVRPAVSPKILKTRFSGIDKDMSAEKRASALKRKGSPAGLADTPSDEAEVPRPQLKKSATSIMPWRRKPRGETMSMLIDSGFFPVQEYIYNKTSPDASPTKRSKLALQIIVNDLPSTRPSSIMQTPIELYSRNTLAHRRSLRNSRRRSGGQYRRRIDLHSNTTAVSPSAIVSSTLLLPPLSPLPHSPRSPLSPLTPTKALSALVGGLYPPTSPIPKSPQPSPGILEVIPEDQTPTPEPSIQATEHETPRQTEIHLSTGTILTVNPPELTAHRRSIYIQNPIRLSVPTVMPRKNSIASLDPFSTSVTLPNIPRRKSEDVVREDLCSWYATWGFETVGFAPDDFGIGWNTEDTRLRKVVEEPECPVDTAFRFSTPPPPVAREVARGMLGLKTGPKPRPGDLGVVGEGRKEGDRYSSGSEGSSVDGVWKTNSREGSVGGSSVGGSDVEEVKEGWWESRGKRRGSSEGLKAKPRMSSRVRRFVQTASAIL